ncbi:MAG: Crp/Fnr family transcriptional regulator [Thermodesulfovibrionales bacterium]
MSDIEIDGLTLISGIEKIQESFLFKGLSYDETRQLAGICTLTTVSDATVIIEEHSLGEDLYLIVRGEVTVYTGDDDNKNILATLKPGDIFGEMSLIDDLLTSASVASRGETTLLRISKRDLEGLMEYNDRLAAKVYRSFCMALSRRLREANERLEGAEPHG